LVYCYSAGPPLPWHSKMDLAKNRRRRRRRQITADPEDRTPAQSLHFVCHRGAIFQFDECPVVAQMPDGVLPGGIGTPNQEVERFILKSESDFSCGDGTVSLRYPSLNKVFPGIFNRLHLSKGKQNTNRSIYYHAAWKTRDSKGQTEYSSLWNIRNGVRQRKWKCPEPSEL